MTIEITEARQQSTEQIPVRVVDSDVHPTPKRGELEEFIPAPYQQLFRLRGKGAGGQNYYDAPDYANAYAMRTDTFPRKAVEGRQKDGGS